MLIKIPILSQRCHNIALYHNSLAILGQHFVFAGFALLITIRICELDNAFYRDQLPITETSITNAFIF